MMYQIMVSHAAQLDLRQIYHYIASVLLSKDTAKKQLARLEQSIRSLRTMPQRYPIYDQEKWQHLRMLSIDNYCIFYTVDLSTQQVNIARILYGRRNFDLIFNHPS